MKITDVQAVYPKWKYLPTGAWQSHFWQIVVRVETDLGAVGFGYGGGGNPGCIIINEHFRELLVGRRLDGVDDIQAAWDVMYRGSIPYGRKGIAMMALSGVDLALWDLLGKARSLPVYELLGGLKREKVRAYATGMQVERYRDMGYRANKFDPGRSSEPAEIRKTVAAARRARRVLGKEALLMTDCYMAWDADTGLKMAEALLEFDIYWFEDLLTPDDLDEQAALRQLIRPVLLAGGEHEFSQHGFAQIARTSALDIWQPDITWCGGITAGLRILELAREAGVAVTPHRGGEIWGLHFIAATDCEDLAETHPERWTEPHDELWLDEPRVLDGYIAPLDHPGFGVRVNEEML